MFTTDEDIKRSFGDLINQSIYKTYGFTVDDFTTDQIIENFYEYLNSVPTYSENTLFETVTDIFNSTVKEVLEAQEILDTDEIQSRDYFDSVDDIYDEDEDDEENEESDIDDD